MIERSDVREVARELRQAEGVERVLLARRDGVPFFDELTLADRDHAAAATASTGGMAPLICDALRLGSAEGAAIFGTDGTLIIRPLEAEFVLAVVAASNSDVADLYRRMRKQARILDAMNVSPSQTVL